MPEENIEVAKFDEDNGSEPEGWNRFCYRVYKHNGWLARRNDSISYVGDTMWKTNVSLDLDMGCLRKYYMEAFTAGRKKSDDGQNADATDSVSSIDPPTEFLIPLFEQDKTIQFASFDLRDRGGRPINLMLRSASAQVCLAVLLGSLLEEDKGARKNEEGKEEEPGKQPILSISDPLVSVIAEWFTMPNLPVCGEKVIQVDDEHALTNIRQSFIDFIGKYASERKWRDKEKADTVKLFESCYDAYPIFRYFIWNFAYKWLGCCVIQNDIESFSVIKYSYTTSRYMDDIKMSIKDLIADLREGRFRKRTKAYAESCTKKSIKDRIKDWIKSSELLQTLIGINFEYELSNVGVAEVAHTIMNAPKGLRLAPVRPEGVGETNIYSDAQFFIVDDPYPFMNDIYDPAAEEAQLAEAGEKNEAGGESESGAAKDRDSDKNEKPISAQGSLTPGVATMKILYPWSDENGEGDSSRLRRLPVGGYRMHRYLMTVAFCPELGFREFGGMLLAFFSACFFALCAVLGLALLEGQTIVGTALAFATLAITTMTFLDKPSFLRQEIAYASKWLVHCTIVIDVVGLIALFLFAYFATDGYRGMFEATSWSFTNLVYV